MKQDTLNSALQRAWNEYKAGDYITEEDLMKKYGCDKSSPRKGVS